MRCHSPSAAVRQLPIALLVITVAAGCSKETSVPPPPRINPAVEMPGRDSTVVVPISISIPQLRDKLNAEVPRRIYSFDEDRSACIPKQTAKVCLLPHPAISLFGHKVQDASCGKWLVTDVSPAIDCHLTGAVDRGDIQLSANGNALDVSVPLSASVTARGRGEIGKKIQATVNGAMVLAARITPGIGSDWTPQLTLDPSYKWTTPPNFHILGIEVTIAGKVDPALRQAMDQFREILLQRVSELQVRTSAEALWKKAYEPFLVSNNPDVWIRFTPSGVGISGISSDDRALTMTLMASGATETFVGPRPEPAQQEPLPPLQKDMPTAGFAFYLPIFADYSAATGVLKRLLLVGKAQVLDVPGLGSTQVTFTDVTLYPTTGSAIAVGLTMRAKTQGRWFSTKGIVWATGRIKVDNAALKIEADDIDYGADTNSSAMNLLISIARTEPIKRKIETALGYDFSSEYAIALKKANAALNQSLPNGITVSGAITRAVVDQIVPTSRGIYMGMDVLGDVRIQALAPLAQVGRTN